MSEPAPGIVAGNPAFAGLPAFYVPGQTSAAGPGGFTYPEPPAYFTAALEDAELLLKYAAETGVDVDVAVRDSILEARAAMTTGWTEPIAADLLQGLTLLSAKLKPVTAESLRYYSTRPSAAKYWRIAIVLAILIIPFSIASFVTSGTLGLANLINQDITNANALAAELTTQFTFTAPQQPTSPAGPSAPAQSNASGNTAVPMLPPGLSASAAITELQTFAGLIRSIYSRTRQLNKFIANWGYDPFAAQVNDPKVGYKTLFQWPVPLPHDLRPCVDDRITVFQTTRKFGQDVINDVAVAYGAIASCILPVLYALLGTCAYLLRSYAQGMSARTYVPSHSDSAHFLIAGIAGGVVGLFSNFTLAPGASIPPLAIAFVVGYSVDVFFSFLEGLIQAFSKRNSGTAAG